MKLLKNLAMATVLSLSATSCASNYASHKVSLDYDNFNYQFNIVQIKCDLQGLGQFHADGHVQSINNGMIKFYSLFNRETYYFPMDKCYLRSIKKIKHFNNLNEK